LQSWQSRANLTIIENAENLGLYRQIPRGISHVLDLHERVIVLEDDILVSPFFLDFMNEALSLYSDNDQVMQVSGFMFDVDEKLPETFFYNVNSCWGWGTWKRAWQYYVDDATSLLKRLTKVAGFSAYDFNGGQNNCFYDQLVKNHLGDLKTWAVKWHTSMYLRGGYCLHPRKTLVKNIGFDTEATNCLGPDSRYQGDFVGRKISVQKIPVEKCEKAYAAVSKVFSGTTGFKERIVGEIRKRLKSFIAKTTPDPVFGAYLKPGELEELKMRPRYFSGEASFLGKPFKFSDATTFLGGIIELFHENKYQFTASKKDPLILDCGANIGLSVLYFKKMYPKSIIHAFEPDPELFEMLEQNIESFGLSDVFLHSSAIWVENSEVAFFSEGGFSGRISDDELGKSERVQCERLSDLLDKKIDFLKLDIEGAEVEVIEDCRDSLHNIDHLFIEYHSQAGKKQQLDVILKRLTDAGFKYQIKDVFSAKSPYLKVDYMATMDLQLEIFAFRDETRP
jgi:FkbM family methyltransferase